jgi:hypothetical protein
MSLDVTEPEVELAARGKMSDEAFVGIIERSLPFAYGVVERLADGLKHGATVVFDQPPHMDDADRAQLLRVFASTSMRTALEQHFISPRGQVLAQHPDLRDC